MITKKHVKLLLQTSECPYPDGENGKEMWVNGRECIVSRDSLRKVCELALRYLDMADS